MARRADRLRAQPFTQQHNRGQRDAGLARLGRSSCLAGHQLSRSSTSGHRARSCFREASTSATEPYMPAGRSEGVSPGARSATALERKRQGRRSPPAAPPQGQKPVAPGQQASLKPMQAAVAAPPRHAWPRRAFRHSSPRVPESSGNRPISGGIRPKPALHGITKHSCKSAASRSGLTGTICWIAPRRSPVRVRLAPFSGVPARRPLPRARNGRRSPVIALHLRH
jgi:hypothetical protein